MQKTTLSSAGVNLSYAKVSLSLILFVDCLVVRVGIFITTSQIQFHRLCLSVIATQECNIHYIKLIFTQSKCIPNN